MYGQLWMIFCIMAVNDGANSPDQKIMWKNIDEESNAEGPVAMTVVRIADHNPDDPCIQPLTYQQDFLDVGNHWNRSSHKLEIPSDSIYFFHINAGTKPGQPLNLIMGGTETFPALSHLSTNHDATDTFGRDIIVNAKAGQKVYVAMDEDSDVYADAGRHTSFTAFDIKSFMSDVNQTIFSVVRVSDGSATGDVSFDIILVDVNGNWQSNTSQFHVPVSGLYFLTASVGTQAGATSAYADIWSNQQGLVKRFYHHSLADDSEDMNSGSVLVNLQAGDFVYISSINAIPQSDFKLQTSFSGFYYNPATGPPTAWSLYLAGNLNSGAAWIDPVLLTADIDTDGTYNAGIYTVPRSGLYYIQMDITVYTTNTAIVHIVMDDVYTQATVSLLADHSGYTTGNQRFLMELFQGSTLKLAMEPNGIILGGSSYMYTSFCGLMLSEYEFVSPKHL